MFQRSAQSYLVNKGNPNGGRTEENVLAWAFFSSCSLHCKFIVSKTNRRPPQDVKRGGPLQKSRSGAHNRGLMALFVVPLWVVSQYFSWEGWVINLIKKLFYPGGCQCYIGPTAPTSLQWLLLSHYLHSVLTESHPYNLIKMVFIKGVRVFWKHFHQNQLGIKWIFYSVAHSLSFSNKASSNPVMLAWGGEMPQPAFPRQETFRGWPLLASTSQPWHPLEASHLSVCLFVC